MNPKIIYETIYALAARDGREETLFGHSAPLAAEAFSRSLACDGFPELWFEVPLLGEPWFDLHVATNYETLHPDMTFTPEVTGGHPEVFIWFANQEHVARQLILSWDTGSGNIANPAIHLLVSTNDPSLTCDFLEVAGRPDATAAYRAFVERLPEGWFACYAGVFPQRPDLNLRVECVPTRELQQAYAQDGDLLREHLSKVGVCAFGDTLIERCQLLASMPFPLEFQFDVEADGAAGPTLSASSRFAYPPGDGDWDCYDANGAAGKLMQQVEAWGLSDSRWHALADTIYAMRLTHGADATTLYCFPAFLKLRWRTGDPVDAKVYLVASAQEAKRSGGAS